MTNEPRARARGTDMLRRVAISVVLVLTATMVRAQDVGVQPIVGDARAAFDRFEWSVNPGKTYGNPFDPAEVAIDAHFTAPDGNTIILPAFWSQKFTNNRHGHHETLRPTVAGDGGFIVRFAPTSPGAWSMTVVVKDAGGSREAEPVKFDVASSTTARGFIRRAANNRYLAFDSGAAYFPVGLNIAWPHAEPGLADYEKWFASLGGAGGNFARIWMTHPNRMTETKEAGIGRFDLAAMQYYDEVFNLAERNGIAFIVCLNNHRDLLARDQYGESIWGRFPYNAAVGGPATRPSDFITNREARDFYQRRLRYLIGRYSAYTNLACWEFFNEQEFTRVDVSTDWMREMSQYLKAHDPYQHLVSTSAKVPDDQWKLDSIDVTQSHLYVGGAADLVGPVVSSIRRHDRFNKPHLVAELGIGDGGDADRDPTSFGSAIHNGIWASALAGGAGTSGHWWWDNFVDPRNLWHVYSGIAKFSAAVDWARRDFQPIDLPLPVITESSDETFFDLKIGCTGAWGHVPQGEIVVAANGQMNQALPHYFVGPMNRAGNNPVRLRVDLPHATVMAMNVSRVCDLGILRVSVDGSAITDFPFSALPNAPDQKRTRPRDGEAGTRVMYEAEFDVVRTVEIPAGKHLVTIETAAGDWVALESITFRGAQSSRQQLATVALQDAAAGETLVWMYDTRSHWQNDRDGLAPRNFEAVTLDVPVTLQSPLTAVWWNTRSGDVITTQTVAAKDGVARLAAPPFSRDIAVIVRSTTGG